MDVVRSSGQVSIFDVRSFSPARTASLLDSSGLSMLYIFVMSSVTANMLGLLTRTSSLQHAIRQRAHNTPPLVADCRGEQFVLAKASAPSTVLRNVLGSRCYRCL